MIPWLDFIIHIDTHAVALIQQFGVWFYLILFLLVSTETGLLFPILPADSLLFVLGALAAKGDINIFLIYFLIIFAAALGDNMAYGIGRFFGARLKHTKFLQKRKRHLKDAHLFYDKYGSWTVLLARFVPFLRVFAPLVAGITQMKYRRFLVFNLIGCAAWATVFLFAGYLFGGINFVQKNLTIIMFLILALSLIPFALGLHKKVRDKLLEEKKMNGSAKKK